MRARWRNCKSLAAHYGFDLEQPFSRACPHTYNTSCCTAQARRPLLYLLEHGGGAGGRRWSSSTPSRASCPTWSVALARDRCALGARNSWRGCATPSPAGVPGRAPAPEARHVLLGEGAQASSIHAVSQRTLADALQWFQQLRLQGAKAEIADKVVREIVRLHFLNDGPELPEPGAQCRNPFGGEAQRIRPASQIGSGPHRRDAC